MSILWGTCSSNLTPFQLIRQKFVFFMRDVWNSLDTQIVGVLCINYHILYYKILVVWFNIKNLVLPSQKNLVLIVGKYKMNFLCEEKKNTQNEHCLPSQVAHMCTIWGNLNKLCHGFGHDLTHLAWKPWNSLRGSSFMRRVFQNIYDSQSLLFFLPTSSHNMT
jgi:hypothetical protein